ncbi:MAG: hypothetical protein WCA83_05070, partial [Azonexus sp.]
MGKILEINGPLVKLLLPEAVIGEQVRVGHIGLVGEVIGRDGDTALAQLYEDTGGLRPGEVADGLGWPLSVELGPGLLNAIFDGVQRPLNAVREKSGDRIARGVSVPSLPRDRRWHFIPDPQRQGTPRINGGDVLGTVRETESILHRILAAPKTHGELLELAPEGDYTVDEVIGRVRLADGTIEKLRMFHRWPVRTPRPFRKRDHAIQP